MNNILNTLGYSSVNNYNSKITTALSIYTEKTVNEDGSINYLEKENTDYKASEEFLQFMKTNFPQTKLIEVFDFVSSFWLHFPYLGSIAIDCEKDDEVFVALSEKYGNPYEDAIKNNAVF